ncbi:hypothetical protein ABVT39_007569 [Epinephelus coioides]
MSTVHPLLKACLIMDQRINLKWWLHFLLLCLIFGASFGEVRYILPEEMQRGSVIGNVARDLGLKVSELDARRARVVAEGTSQLCELDTASGNLLISQRIDREELCAQATFCTLQYQLLLEDPLQAYSIVLDIADINDNSPVFAAEEIRLDLVESTVLGRRFPLESAHDPDLGTNSVHLSRCGTLLKDERYDSFMTTGSWRGDFRFGSSTDTDTLKQRSAAYQKNTLRRASADRATLKVRAGASHPCYVVK